VIELKSRVKTIKQMLEEQDESLEERRKKADKHNKYVAQEIKKLRGERSKLVDSKKPLKTKLKKQEEIEERCDKLEDKISHTRRRLASTSYDLDCAKSAVRAIKSSIVEARKKKGTVCPTCEQRIAPSIVAEKVKRIKESLYKEKVRLARSEYKKKSLKQRLHELEKKHTIAKSHIDKNIHKQIEQIDERIRNAKKQESMLKGSRIVVSETDTKQHKVRLKKLRIRYKTACKDLRNIVAKTDKLKRHLDICNFWIGGFSNRGIKSYIINGVLDYLEQSANDYLYELTDGYIKVKWHSEKKQKTTGKTVDKLTLEVRTGKRGNKEYHDCSEGEKARVWLSMELALNNLMRTTIDLALIDEILDGLDSEGVRRAMRLLSKESAKRKIVCISHRKGLKRSFPQKKVVVMEDDVSRLEAA
jgi:DNA repair exonuclease SbcCD ATPase subunit